MTTPKDGKGHPLEESTEAARVRQALEEPPEAARVRQALEESHLYHKTAMFRVEPKAARDRRGVPFKGDSDLSRLVRILERAEIRKSTHHLQEILNRPPSANPAQGEPGPIPKREPAKRKRVDALAEAIDAALAGRGLIHG